MLRNFGECLAHCFSPFALSGYPRRIEATIFLAMVAFREFLTIIVPFAFSCQVGIGQRRLLAALQYVQASINGNTMNPGAKGTVAPEIAQGTKGTYESILRGIGGIVALAQNPVTQIVDAVLVSANQLVKRAHIAIQT